jgi:hypothetical protein
MPDEQPNQSVPLTPHEPADMQMKKMAITPEIVMAISDRIYGMLLRELKVERERQRFLNRSRPR